jgi:hypothetical protein
MTVQELHYQFKLNMDRVDTLSATDFNREEIDYLLNEAQLLYVKRLYNGTNPLKTAFEQSQKRIDDLSTIVIKFPLQPALTPTKVQGVYEVPLSSLSFEYLFLIAAYCDIQLKEDCSKKIPLKFVQHDDYREALRDPFNSPSTESIPYNFGRSTNSSGTSIYIYPQTFDISSVYIEYIKKPARISYGTYTHLDGVSYPTNSSELPPHTHDEIVNIACQIASLNIESPEYIRLKTEKVFAQE